MNMELYDAKTHEKLQLSNLWTGDEKSYQMYPDHTLIKCQFIDDKGNFIKGNNEFGNEIIKDVMVLDQRIFYSDILYACEYPIGSGIIRCTRASLSEPMKPTMPE
jgi:hypothetical protein